jgi:uncharacterized protein YbjT (DUF2867 family)
MSELPSTTRSALLAGATGLVGRELLRAMSAGGSYASVCVLVRKPAPELSQLPQVQTLQVDFESLPASLPAVDDVFIALGTTIKVAGSQQAFRRVDHDYVVDVARAALASGAKRLGLVSALGASEASRVFYNRVKGETERDVAALGYDCVVIARPSLLLGDRDALGQHARAGENWAKRLLGPLSALVPAQFRPVQAAAVADALLSGVRSASTKLDIIESRDMHRR